MIFPLEGADRVTAVDPFEVVRVEWRARSERLGCPTIEPSVVLVMRDGPYVHIYKQSDEGAMLGAVFMTVALRDEMQRQIRNGVSPFNRHDNRIRNDTHDRTSVGVVASSTGEGTEDQDPVVSTG